MVNMLNIQELLCKYDDLLSLNHLQQLKVLKVKFSLFCVYVDDLQSFCRLDMNFQT